MTHDTPSTTRNTHTQSANTQHTTHIARGTTHNTKRTTHNTPRATNSRQRTTPASKADKESCKCPPRRRPAAEHERVPAGSPVRLPELELQWEAPAGSRPALPVRSAVGPRDAVPDRRPPTADRAPHFVHSPHSGLPWARAEHTRDATRRMCAGRAADARAHHGNFCARAH